MKILYITHKPVYPLVDGGCKAMASFLDLLIQDFEIHHISISTNKHPFDISNYPENVKFKSIEHFHIDTDLSFFRSIKSLFEKGSYNVNRFYNKDLENNVCKKITELGINCVVSESIFPLAYLEAIQLKTQAKVYLRAHNIEHKLWQQHFKESTGLKRLFLKKLTRDIRKFELNVFSEIDGCIFLSEEDQNYFKKLKNNVPSITIPVTIDTHNQQVDYLKSDFFFLGAMNWEPNIQAVKDLIENIFPKIKEQLPSATLHLGGSFFPESIKSSPEKGVIVHGFVESLFDFFNTGIQLVPLKSGSGVRIKLLETLNYGVPTVCTTIAAGGLKESDSTIYIVENNEDQFIKAAIDLANNINLRKEIGHNAKRYMEKAYNFENLKKELIEFIH